MDKKVLRNISYGMYIVGCSDNKNSGCIINTLTQLTSDNPVISICVNKENYTNKIIKKTNKFSVSILSKKIDPNIISTFGFTSSKDNDKFEYVEYKMINDVPVVTSGVCGYITCKVKNIVDIGTHNLFIAQVDNGVILNEDEPMTYKYYNEIIKGKAPKKAPTYQEENINLDEEVWVCDVCGYVHKGPISDDFVCPICKMDRSHFKKNNI